MRADARRNRARILEVAFAAFAADGLAVPVHEIARRAGVGTGTVSRHFPTKESLFEAIIQNRVSHILGQARVLAEQRAGDPGAAFRSFFLDMVTELAVDRGLADALTGAGVDLAAATASAGQEITAMLGMMLGRAQQAGAVRGDVEAADVKALMMGCLGDDGEPSDAALRRRVDVIYAGLRAR
ncbi:MAG TPA: helix-turn-helix domain-containing protein [Streptosporangiaceae bacterium]|nr:helix-turn-helix domain-containing protein [Streptosporangiaceae bacterium]